MANQKPVHEIRLGKVKAAIWKNETDAGPRFSVTIVRLYKKDGEQHWETSTSFGRDELPLVSKVADMVHTWIYQQSEKGETSQAPARETRQSSDQPNGRRRERTATR